MLQTQRIASIKTEKLEQLLRHESVTNILSTHLDEEVSWDYNDNGILNLVRLHYVQPNLYRCYMASETKSEISKLRNEFYIRTTGDISEIHIDLSMDVPSDPEEVLLMFSTEIQRSNKKKRD